LANFDGIYDGVVVNNVDPTGQQRITVYVPQVLGQAESAWARPSVPTTYVPSTNDNVLVQFVGGDLSKPTYIAHGLAELANLTGKGHTYYQNTAPTKPVDGDIWFNTTNNLNKPFVWALSGTTYEWLSVQDNGIIASQISADAIDGKTITGATLQTDASDAVPRAIIDSVTGVTVSRAAVRQLVTEPGFGNGLAGWRTGNFSGTLAVASRAMTGDKRTQNMLYVSSAYSSPVNATFDTPVTLQPNTTYTASFTAIAFSNNGEGIYVNTKYFQVAESGGNGQVLQKSQVDTWEGGSVENDGISFTFTTPPDWSGPSTLSIPAYVEYGGSQTGVVTQGMLLVLPQLTDTSGMTAYIDGGMEHCSWDGAPEASSSTRNLYNTLNFPVDQSTSGTLAAVGSIALNPSRGAWALSPSMSTTTNPGGLTLFSGVDGFRRGSTTLTVGEAGITADLSAANAGTTFNVVGGSIGVDYNITVGNNIVVGNKNVATGYVPGTYRSLTSNSAVMGATETIIPELSSISLSTASGRWYWWRLDGMVYASAAANCTVSLRLNGSEIKRSQIYIPGTYGVSFSVSKKIQGPGAATLDIYVANGGFAAGASYPTETWVEDAGSY
jgi:hypothetical protein